MKRPARNASLPHPPARRAPARKHPRERAENAGARQPVGRSDRKSRRTKSIVSEKGQVTIPKIFRERLDIRPGQVLDLTEEGGKLVIRKIRAGERDPIESVFGILGQPGSTDKWIEEIRGKAELP